MAIVPRGSLLKSARRLARLSAAAVLLLCHSWLAAAQPAVGPQACPCRLTLPRPGDELWVVSSRGLGCGPPEEAAARMKYWRLQSGRWEVSRQDEFLMQPADMTTSFFIVGNDYSHAQTLEIGWFAYSRLVRQAPDGPPLRFVIWSWPSDRLPGRRLKDAKVKLARIPAASFYLAWLVDRMADETPISMSGSSFGARIIVSSLELLAGGRVCSYRLPDRDARRPRHVNAVLMGAAFDNDDLLPGQRYGRALSQVNRMLLFVNSSDRALKFYRLLFGRRLRLEAVGFTGLVAAHRLGPDRDKIETRDVADELGHEHGAKVFFEHHAIVRLMAPYLIYPPTESQVIEALGR